MKSSVYIALIAAVLSNILHDEHEYLKNFATYEVVDIEKNIFSNYTNDELKALFSSPKELRRPTKAEVQRESVWRSTHTRAIMQVDLREKFDQCFSYLNRGSCGGTWAFAITTTLAAGFCTLAEEPNTPLVLSPQTLISCDKLNDGCKGGEIESAWNYLSKNGVHDLDTFPFTSGDGKTIPPCPPDDISKRKYYSTHNRLVTGQAAIQASIDSGQAVSAGFVVYSDFLQYKAGIYTRKSNIVIGQLMGVVIGYGESTTGWDYWIVLLSWGPDWGEMGTIRMTKNQLQLENNGYVGDPVFI